MRNKNFAILARTALLVSALLLSTTALAGTLGYYNWSATTTGVVGEFTNNGTGGGVKATTAGTSSIGLYGYATGSTAQATRGYNSSSGYGVYGRSVNGTGVYGENNSTTGGYGGYFTGFYGVRGVATTWAGWFSSYQTNGVGVRGYSDGSNGYGVYGSNPKNVAVYGDGGTRGGYFVGTGTSWAAGVKGYTASPNGDAVQAVADGYNTWGVYASTTGEQGRGVSATTSGSSAYAGYFTASNYRGMYVNGASGQYDLYVPDYAYIAGWVFGPKGVVSFLARNDAGEALAPGDLVAFSGVDPTALDNGVVSVVKVGAAQGVVVGVVQGAYVVEAAPSQPPVPEARPEALPPVPPNSAQTAPAPVPDGEEPAAPFQVHEEGSAVVEAPAMPPKDALTEADTGRFAGGTVDPGQYLLVAFQGFVKVRVAVTKPIKVGDWVVVGPDGSVTSAPARAYSDTLDRGYTIVGRAMEALGTGRGEVLVRLDLR